MPYLHGIPKIHKTPFKFRFIAGVSSHHENSATQSTIEKVFNRPSNTSVCSTTAASKKLSKILQLVLKLLKEKDEIFFEKYGYRRFWVVNNISSVFPSIKNNRLRLKGKQPRTFDFTRMYTMLPHDKIITNVKLV